MNIDNIISNDNNNEINFFDELYICINNRFLL